MARSRLSIYEKRDLTRLTVSVIMVHLSEHVHSIGIKSEIGTIHHPEGVQLMPQSAFPKYELRCICSVQTVNTICAADAILQQDVIAPPARRSQCHAQWSPVKKKLTQSWVLTGNGSRAPAQSGRTQSLGLTLPRCPLGS